MPTGFSSLVVVVLVAAAAPILVDLVPGRIRIPQVILLLLAGIAIGPEVLSWADPGAVDLFAQIGMGFLFLMAGYELEPQLLRARESRLALWSWTTSLLLGLAFLLVLFTVDVATSPVVVALALTTTSLGTLLPILRDHQMLGGSFGRFVLAAGAVGELAPIVAMAIFLGAGGTGAETVALLAFLGLAVVVARFPSLVGTGRLARIIVAREHATAQSTLRLAIALLFVLLWLADDLGFDSILGAFVAGMVLRAWAPGDVSALERKLDAVGYGFFIPIFFVQSGMTLDIAAIADQPLALLVFLAMLLVLRGLPALFWYRRVLPLRERWQLAFITATALPLLIALTEVGVQSGHMTSSAQATIVGAGVASVLVFPIVAVELRRRGGAGARDPNARGAGTLS